jgi:hypothetical protein
MAAPTIIIVFDIPHLALVSVSGANEDGWQNLGERRLARS